MCLLGARSFDQYVEMIKGGVFWVANARATRCSLV